MTRKEQLDSRGVNQFLADHGGSCLFFAQVATVVANQIIQRIAAFESSTAVVSAIGVAIGNPNVRSSFIKGC